MSGSAALTLVSLLFVPGAVFAGSGTAGGIRVEPADGEIAITLEKQRVTVPAPVGEERAIDSSEVAPIEPVYASTAPAARTVDERFPGTGVVLALSTNPARHGAPEEVAVPAGSIAAVALEAYDPLWMGMNAIADKVWHDALEGTDQRYDAAYESGDLNRANDYDVSGECVWPRVSLASDHQPDDVVGQNEHLWRDATGSGKRLVPFTVGLAYHCVVAPVLRAPKDMLGFFREPVDESREAADAAVRSGLHMTDVSVRLPLVLADREHDVAINRPREEEAPRLTVNAAPPALPGFGVRTEVHGVSVNLEASADSQRSWRSGLPDAPEPLTQWLERGRPTVLLGSAAAGLPAAVGQADSQGTPTLGEPATPLGSRLAAPWMEAPLVGWFAVVLGATGILCLLSLLHRLRSREKLLSHRVREAVYASLLVGRGLTAGEAGQTVGVSRITARYHLQILENYGFVRSQTVGKKILFYPDGSGPKMREDRVQAVLGRQAAQRLLAVVAKSPSLPLRQLARAAGLTLSATYWYVNCLEREGLLVTQRTPRRIEYVVSPLAAAFLASPGSGSTGDHGHTGAWHPRSGRP